MDSELLGRDLEGIFDQGAPRVRLDEVERRASGGLGKPPNPRPVWLLLAAFAAVLVAGSAISLLTQPVGPAPLDTPATTPAGTSSTSPGDPPLLDQPTGSHVFFSTDTQLTVIDVDAGSFEVRDIPELAPGDPPYRLAWRGDRLVFYGQTDLGRAVMSLDPSRPKVAPSLVKEGAFFIPSAVPDRVWAFESNSQGVTTMQELTVDGVATTSEVATPRGLWPGAAVEAGVLFQGDGSLELYDARGAGPIGSLPGPFPVAAWRNRLVTCTECDRLHLIDLDQGTDRTVDLPVGVASVSGYAGAFSPDGRHVAVLGFLTQPPITSETEMVVTIVDFASGIASVVPGSLAINRFSFPMLAWHHEGDWLFVGPVYDDDTEKGHLLAARPGDETAYVVPIDIGTVYYGMAAD